MQKLYAIFGTGLVIVLGLIAYATTRIPFIYANRYFVLLAIAYFLLVVWFSCFVIYGFFTEEEDTAERVRKNKPFAYILIFFTPLMFSFLLSLLLPIAVDVFSSNTVVREYRLVKVEPRNGRLTSSISTIHAADRARQPITFQLKNHILNKLNLNAGENFLVSGRSSYFGFVIDEINDVKT